MRFLVVQMHFFDVFVVLYLFIKDFISAAKVITQFFRIETH